MKPYEEELETTLAPEEEDWAQELWEDEAWLHDGIGDEEDEFAPLPQTIKVKYNGKEQEIPLADAPAFIQKGMNYDHVKEELTALKQSPAMQFLQNLAQRENISLEEAAQLLTRREQDDIVLARRQEGHDPDTARALAEAETARMQMQAERDAAQAALAEHSRQNDMTRDFAQFLQNHPDLDPDTIPESVWQQVEAGIPIENAWAPVENELLRRELAQLRQDVQNAARSTGRHAM